MITIDYQSKLPLYEQIAKRFQTLILKGALPPDSQMFPIRRFSLNRQRKHFSRTFLALSQTEKNSE